MDLKIKLILVVDPQLLSEAGGDMLVAKIPSPNKIEQLKFQPGMFFNLQAGSLLVVDCSMLENLRDVTAGAVQDGSFKRCGLVLLVNVKALDSGNKLTQLNLSLRSLWSSTMVVIKPWNGGIARAEDLLHSSHRRQDQPRDIKAPQVVVNPGPLVVHAQEW
jgi:hypothetical protein